MSAGDAIADATGMKTLMAGLVGYASLRRESESVRVADTAITVVGTLLLAVTWALLR